jgi:hypothetical protein
MVCGFKPANLVNRVARGRKKAVFFFRSKLISPGG